jgi:hypothetical protein
MGDWGIRGVVLGTAPVEGTALGRGFQHNSIQHTPCENAREATDNPGPSWTTVVIDVSGTVPGITTMNAVSRT